MRMFDDLRLAVKLPIVLGILALVSLLAMGYTGYHVARSALINVGETRIATALDAKQHEFETWFAVISADLKSQAANPLTIRALRDFSTAWSRMGSDASKIVVDQFVTNNPYPQDQRYKFDKPAVISDYSIAHSRYHAGFLSVLQEKGYHDVLLIDVVGNVLYSVSKELDLGQNVLATPLRSTQIGRVARRVMQMPDASILFSDFEVYGPSYDAAASFVAAPIKSVDGRVLGALVFQLSIGQMDAILARTYGPDLGVRSYLVGRDHKLRSDVQGSNEPVALSLSTHTGAVKKAFGQDHSITHEPGLFGVPSVLVTGHFSVPGLDLALIFEQPVADLLLPVHMIAERMAIEGAAAMAVLSILVFCLARSLSRPLVQTADSMRRIAAGDYRARGRLRPRHDEIGIISGTLETFREGLAQAAEQARDGAFKSAAFAGSSAALMIIDRDYVITYLNPASARLLHMHRDMIGRHYHDFDPDTVVGQSLNRILGQQRWVELRLAKNGGARCNSEISIGDARFALDIEEVLMPGDGCIGFVVEWRDVTVERMNLAILSAIDRNLATAEFGADGRMLKANDKMSVVLDAPAEAIIGLTYHDILTRDPANPLDPDAIWARLMAGESVFGSIGLRPDGAKEAVIDGGFSPVRDSDGQLLSVLLMGSDVTEAQLGLRLAEDRRRRMEDAQARVVDALRIGLRRLSEGDLSANIEDEFAEDYETLRLDFNMAVAQLGAAMTKVIANAAVINDEVRDIAGASEDLSKRTEHQAAALEQTAAALDELTVSVRSAATGAAEANAVVGNARASAETSGKVVRETVAAMGEIERSSEKIARISGVIEEIAFQTNLLALNAGVEAARAGDAGRGFAVVATEVRALAQRSSNSAREIDELITDAASHVKRGVGLVGQTGQALQDIVGSVGHIAQRMNDIAAAAQEQSSGLAEINLAINQIDHVTQQNNALFGETAIAGQRLKAEAEALTETIGRFQVARLPADPEESSWRPVGPGPEGELIRQQANDPQSSRQLAPDNAGLPFGDGQIATGQAQAGPARAVALAEDWDEF